jgi:hypothetical protein
MWIQATPLGRKVSTSPWLFPTIESVHIIGLALVVGAVLRLDLRLLGFSRHVSVTDVAGSTMPWAWTGTAIAVTTGLLMFSSEAVVCFHNRAFRAKMLMLLLIALNTLVYEFITRRNVDAWDVEHATPIGAKLAAGVSFTLWIGVVAAGRWIAYT